MNPICVKEPIPHVFGFTKPCLREFGGKSSAWGLDLDQTLADFRFVSVFTEYIFHKPSDKMPTSKLAYRSSELGGPMRFYFNIQDKLAIQDEVGREFVLASDAVVYARYLAADLRCLETDVRPRLSIQVIGEDTRRIHEEHVFA